MKLLIYLSHLFIITICLISCKADKTIDDIIETRTDLTTIEIINYIPTNKNSISTGYIKQSLIKMDNESFSLTTEDFENANFNNHELYFDSLEYVIITKTDNLNIIDQQQLTSILNNYIKTNPNSNTYKENQLRLNGIVASENKMLIVTLETPQNHTLKWSIVKIWNYDKISKRPQIYSTLLANSNSFDYLNFVNHSIHLGDGDFIYRIVLDDNYRFGKNMDIFVSMYSN